MNRIKICTLVTSMVATSASLAGGGPYPLLDFSRPSKGTSGIGEISNKMTLFYGGEFWISPIPGFETYQKEYLLITAMVLSITLYKHRRFLSRKSTAQ